MVTNSGNANACTGPQGFRDALRMAAATADCCDADPSEVLVCSTGVIGRPMPMSRVLDGVRAASGALAVDGGERAARAIMTTDTVAKTAAAYVTIGGRLCTVGGMAKGAGMIHPDMATLLAFVTTDAAVERAALQALLTDVCSRTFNCLSIDGDTSTNDTLLLLANGASAAPMVVAGTPAYTALLDAVEDVCTSLVEQLAADAEGATKAICVSVRGAADDAQARAAARTVVLSPLVKSAVHGADPNWGRIVAALGRSGAELLAGPLPCRHRRRRGLCRRAAGCHRPRRRPLRVLRGTHRHRGRSRCRRGAGPRLGVRPLAGVRPHQCRLHDMRGSP